MKLLVRKNRYQTVKVEKEEKQLTEQSVTCNKCGKTTFNDDQNYDYGWWDNEHQNISLRFGYGSSHDNEQWNFDICEKCLVEFIKTFKYVPDGFYQDEHSLEGENHQEVFDHWKQTGEWNDLLFHSYQELKELNGWIHTDYLNDLVRRFHPNKPYFYDDGDYEAKTSYDDNTN